METAVGDFKGDGDIDVVVSQRFGNGQVFLNDGAGNLTTCLVAITHRKWNTFLTTESTAMAISSSVFR
ncbi:MAG: hypothetical protein CMJ78_22760 [Planctomycetaceae bacterium]|nr:hypothetical protein [Planctomycetaceae bacterium]